MDINLNNLLPKVTVCLVAFLEKVLPTLSQAWWEKLVVNSLSFQQQRRVEQSKSTSLAALDLSALLRVFDQNWYQISTKLNLSPEIRHFVKEMQTVRNKWAHASTEKFPVDDVYRDLDTLQRFAMVIGSDEGLLQEIRDTKHSLVSKEPQNSERGGTTLPESSQAKKELDAEFRLSQIVFLKSNPKIKGPVIEILLSQPEHRFKVYVDGAKQTYYASQLQAEIQSEEDLPLASADQFHAYLTALQIQYPGLSTLYSLNAARVDFIPYQYRPVLRFIRSDRPRLLIADSVGVGKTIEAGLILRELQARRDVRSVLIICPRPLVTERKWLNEMKRFEERFNHLDGPTLRYCIDEMDLNGVWSEEHQRVIVPYSLFDESLLFGSSQNAKGKRKKGLLSLDPPPRFDLVIVDEAHHIRNQDTFSHKAVRFFCDHAEAAIFLTATPIQLGSQDLFVLLNTLRPDLIIDQESFQHMAEPNPYINQAVALTRAQESDWTLRTKEALDQAATTAWGENILKNNPEFNRICSKIAEDNVTADERVQLITDLESLHTFSGIINRTRRRDIGDFTVRRPETVPVEFTPTQKDLHDNLLRLQAEIFIRLHGDLNVKFMMTTIRRQAASCLFGLVPFLEEILSRHLDELSWEESDDSTPAPQSDAIGSIETQIIRLLEQARGLDPYDPKLEALRQILKNKQELPNNKVMVFSSFRHTLNYLYHHLKEAGFRVGMVHGGTPEDERVNLRIRFEMPRDANSGLDILLFSEIGCEGLDYQFCDCMVNYDLPWNPMRVEQRIGRIDRNGQKSETVAIYNLITPGTVDADIYERCLLRIGVFNNALGASEEILGEITQEIQNIAENFSLNDEERRGKLQQLADNKIRLIQEQEELEQRQVELFGIQLPKEQMRKEIEEASSYWLSADSIKRLIMLYFQQLCGADQEFILGEKPLKTLRLSQEARAKLLNDFQQMPRQNHPAYREWENYLKGGNPHLSITFESECAIENREAVFIMPLHPLVKQAAMSVRVKEQMVTSLKTSSNLVPAGKYRFEIYQWQFHGIREDLILRPIASSEVATPHLAKLLETAEEVVTAERGVADLSAWQDLDAEHHKLWSEARAKHRLRNQELAQFRKESLTTSHRARMLLLQEQLSQASNEKIQKMRQSQIAAAESDYARHIQELDIAKERADITAEIVAYGILQVERGLENAK